MSRTPSTSGAWRLLASLGLALGLSGAVQAQCPGKGDCCEGNGSVGCDDAKCCSIVCAQDPLCCAVEWDGICAGLALNLCGDLCGGGGANDNCADAIEIFNGDTDFSNVGATDDGPEIPDGECSEAFPTGELGSDIWYVYNSSFNGTLIISTCDQAGYDTFLASYTGDCDDLTLHACNDDGDDCGGFTSLMEVPVESGGSYLIRVGGFNGASGTGTLSLTKDADNPACPGDGCCYAANGSPGCDDADCCNAVCAADPFCCDSEWDEGCGEAGFALCFTDNGCPGDTNGDFAVDVQDLVNVVLGWGSTGADGSDVNGSCLVDVEDMVLVIVSWGLCGDPDDCSNAQDITFGTWAFSTVDATQDGPDPGCAGTWSADTWFDFTAEASGPVELSTCNDADYDTAIAVYQGCECPADLGNLVACNDDGAGCAGFTSLVSFVAVEGECYKIQLAGFSGATGSGNLTVSELEPPCVVPCKDGADEGEDCGADINGGCNATPTQFGDIACGETVCGTGWATGGTRDTDWYLFTHDGGLVEAELTSSFAGVVFIVDGIAGCAPVVVGATGASSDCEPGAIAQAELPAGEYVVFVAPAAFEGTPCGAGNSYTVTLTCGGEVGTGACCILDTCEDGLSSFDCAAIGGLYQGDDTLCADVECGLMNDDCADAEEIFGGDTPYSNIGATDDGPEIPDGECSEAFPAGELGSDVWFLYNATGTGTLNVSTCDQASYDSFLAAYSGGCDALTLDACNDDGDGCGGFTSNMDLPVVAGNAYLIRVGGFNGASGTGTLTLSGP